MVSLFTLINWGLVFIGGVLAGHAITSKKVPLWIRITGILFVVVGFVGLVVSGLSLMMRNAL